MKRLLPSLIFLSALALRLWGIRWGLPNADHTFSYHTDETVVLISSLAVHPLLFLLDPGYYAYGCLVPITNGLVLDLGTWTHLLTPRPDSASALLACRLVTAVLGAATCGVLLATGKRLWGEASGFAAGAVYAVAPLAVQHAHFATVDVHATFWVSLCLLQTSKILGTHPPAPSLGLYPAPQGRGKGSNFRPLLWAGAFAGLAAAAKYNAGVVLLAPLAASFLEPIPRLASSSPPSLRQGRGKGGWVLLAALAGFVAGCPAVILNPSGLFAGLANEARISRTDHGGIFAGLPTAYLTQVLQSFWTMGMFLPFVVVVALVAALVRRKPADLALLAFIVPYFVMIGLSKAMYARYALPLFPPLFLLVGALAATEKRAGLVRGALAFSAIPSVALALWLNLEFSTPDTRDRALVWIRAQNFKKIGFATGPWHYHPPLVPGLTHPQPAKAKEAAAASGFLVPADGEWNVEQLKTENPDAVILSEAEYARTDDNANRIGFLSFLRRKDEDGKRVMDFRVWSRRSAIGIRDLPHTPSLPYDMGYVSPSIVVLFRR